MSSGDLADVKAMLQAQIDGLIAELVPEGYRAGAYWMTRNPIRGDKNVGSMWVRLYGPPGVWKDEAMMDKAGDILSLIEYCVQLPDMKATLRWARDFLKLDAMPVADRQRRAALEQSRQVSNVARDADKAAANAKKAFGVYLASKKLPLLGSVADRYLQSRGIHLSRLPRLPGALGWLRYSHHAENGADWPVLVAGLSGANNKIMAVHRTFLARDGFGKAPVSPVRKIWPSFGGAAIRLWRGSSTMSVDQAAKCGLRETLAIVEGVEDGLSVVQACPELRVWCAGSLGNLASIILPECIHEVIVCADNDWGKPQAERLLNKALASYTRQGSTVRVARSHVGKDVNDALRGA